MLLSHSFCPNHLDNLIVVEAQHKLERKESFGRCFSHNGFHFLFYCFIGIRKRASQKMIYFVTIAVAIEHTGCCACVRFKENQLCSEYNSTFDTHISKLKKKAQKRLCYISWPLKKCIKFRFNPKIDGICLLFKNYIGWVATYGL